MTSVRGLWRSMKNLPNMEDDEKDEKISEEIDRQLAQSPRGATHQNGTFEGHTILYVGDDLSKKNQLMQSIRNQYIAEMELDIKEEDEPKAKMKEYTFEVEPIGFRIFSLSNKPGDVRKWVKFFEINACVLIWVISLSEIIKDLQYLRENLDHFKEVQSNASFNKCNFLLLMNDSSEKEVENVMNEVGGFPLTDTEKTKDVKVIHELIEKAFTQRFQSKSENESSFTRIISFHYSHLLDDTLFSNICSCFLENDKCKSSKSPKSPRSPRS